jgi:hypothetical protein
LKKIIQVHEYLVLIVIMGAEVICKSACCFSSGWIFVSSAIGISHLTSINVFLHLLLFP